MKLKQKVALFVPFCGNGHINGSLAVAAELKRRGYRTVFAIDVNFQGKFKSRGHEEELYVRVGSENRAKELKDMQEWVEKVVSESQKPTIERTEYTNTSFGFFTKVVIDTNHLVREILHRVQPDLVFESNFASYPCIDSYGAPMFWICSPNPLFIPSNDDTVPPCSSGYKTYEHEKSRKFFKMQQELLYPLWIQFNSWFIENGGKPLKPRWFFHPSKHLNMYLFPKELDYQDIRPLDDTYMPIDAAIREEILDFELPQKFLDLPGKLIYFSMGTVSSVNQDMVKRLIEYLSKSKNKFIVSKGANGDTIDLPPNMFGANFLPQNKILPLVDLFITHGGNNSLTESLFFGKPMVVLHVFGDQVDNGTRVEEKGLGFSFPAFNVKEDELLCAVEKVLNDDETKSKVEAISKRVRKSKSIENAVDRIEKVIENV